MCGCLALLLGSVAPRFTIFLLWLLTGYTTRAFDSFWVGLAGLVLLPYTTLLYVLMENWQDPIDGFGWFVVALGFLLDLGSYAGGYAQRDELPRYARH